jgi:hypothetical protein
VVHGLQRGESERNRAARQAAHGFERIRERGVGRARARGCPAPGTTPRSISPRSSPERVEIRRIPASASSSRRPIGAIVAVRVGGVRVPAERIARVLAAGSAQAPPSRIADPWSARTGEPAGSTATSAD